MIRGAFPPRRAPHPYLTVAVSLPELRPQWSLVDFLVDSGAAATSVHPTDAIRRLGLAPSQLDPSNWDAVNARRSRGIGGTAEYLETSAVFAFRDDALGWITYTDKLLLSEMRQDNQRLPSLLGWNLLEHLAVTMNGQTRSITFEWLG